MRALLLFAFAGCDGAFDLVEVTLDDGGIRLDGGRTDCALTDDFSTTSLPKWNRTSIPPGSCLPTVVNSELHVPQPPDVDDGCVGRIITMNPVSLDNAVLTIDVLELMQATSGAELWVSLVVDATNFYEFYFNSGYLSAWFYIDDVGTEFASVFHGTNPASWRIEHQPTATPVPTLAFSVNAGAGWELLGSTPLELPTQSLSVEIGSRAYDPVPAQLSRFDNVTVCPL